MTEDNYLFGLLSKYSVDSKGAKEAGNQIYPVLKKWGNDYLIKTEFSGSLAKGTGINLSTDADIFLSLSSTTPESLHDMYQSLCNAVSHAGYPVRRQDVSIGTSVNGYDIDLVPGRRQSPYGNDHSLYRNRNDSWTKTDIQTHINVVSSSGRIDEIRLLKLWRTRHGLHFPSFYIELATLEALRYAKKGEIAKNFLQALTFLSEKIETARIIDPANSNNVVSEDCSNSEKSSIASQAHTSLMKKTWNEIVW